MHTERGLLCITSDACMHSYGVYEDSTRRVGDNQEWMNNNGILCNSCSGTTILCIISLSLATLSLRLPLSHRSSSSTCYAI